MIQKQDWIYSWIFHEDPTPGWCYYLHDRSGTMSNARSITRYAIFHIFFKKKGKWGERSDSRVRPVSSFRRSNALLGYLTFIDRLWLWLDISGHGLDRKRVIMKFFRVFRRKIAFMEKRKKNQRNWIPLCTSPRLLLMDSIKPIVAWVLGSSSASWIVRDGKWPKTWVFQLSMILK